MRSLTVGWALLVLLPAMGMVPAAAQEAAVELGGQVRPRFEFRGVDGFGGDAAWELTSMRTRLHLRAVLPAGVAAFVQIQDVRIWGEELSTVDASADALDLHQGWIEIGDPTAGAHALRVGRQELAYGEERLVGALDWVQQARAFDGVRYRTRVGAGSVDAFVTRLSEGDVSTVEAGFHGLYAALGPVDAYALYNSMSEAGEAISTDQVTLGGRWRGARDDLSWRIEGAYQLGTRAGVDASAYLLALQAGIPLGDAWRAELWYDRLSGDDDPLDETIRVFDTLFATNHKFYGLMDLFTNIPLHTGGRGLQDVALKTTVVVRDRVTVGGDLHSFFLAATDGLASGHLGEELDVTARWSYAPGVALSGGLGLFRGGDAWFDPGNVQTWFFTMLDVVF